MRKREKKKKNATKITTCRQKRAHNWQLKKSCFRALADARENACLRTKKKKVTVGEQEKRGKRETCDLCGWKYSFSSCLLWNPINLFSTASASNMQLLIFEEVLWVTLMKAHTYTHHCFAVLFVQGAWEREKENKRRKNDVKKRQGASLLPWARGENTTAWHRGPLF